MNRLCSICARGGSKGVLNKNLRQLNGKPLLAYSLLQAKASGLFCAVAVSSDSEEILSVAGEYGADFLIRRPDELASDTAAKIPAIQHCLLQAEKLAGVEFETAVDLDATSPLRSVEDIAAVVQLLEDSRAGNVITAMPARRSPYFNLIERDETGRINVAKPLPAAVVRRQDAPLCYDMNASIYAWKRQALLDNLTVFLPDTELYVMPEERSIDIDSELDFFLVECIARKRGELL